MQQMFKMEPIGSNKVLEKDGMAHYGSRKVAQKEPTGDLGVPPLRFREPCRKNGHPGRETGVGAKRQKKKHPPTHLAVERASPKLM